MCGTCGCDDKSTNGPAPKTRASVHHHVDAEHPERVELQANLLAKNDRFAADNRALLQRSGTLALNIMGAPGAGKTRLLESTLGALMAEPSLRLLVLEGDQQTQRDAERIAAIGCPVRQINTGPGCHLDAHMVAHELEHVELKPPMLLCIENIGNLVCPALFDLGAAHAIVVMSVTEGEDKPIKYPHMFRAADYLVLNKVDLAEHVGFNLQQCLSYAREVNPHLRHVAVSAATGAGMAAWLAFLRAELARIAHAPQTLTHA